MESQTTGGVRECYQLSLLALGLQRHVGAGRGALHRDEPETGRGGWGTPFYMGDVIDVVLAPGGPSSGKRKIERVTVHYRMPSYRNKFCDDICKPWLRACVGGHAWRRGVCDTAHACKRMRINAG